MTKQTKAQAALTEAQQWIDAAREEVKERENDLERAQGGLQMYLTIYDVLEKTFARVAAPAKKASKVASKKPSKSKRASGLGDAIKGNLERREPTVGGFADDTDLQLCTATLAGSNETCAAFKDNALHHDKTYTAYHAFVPASTEQSAVVSGD